MRRKKLLTRALESYPRVFLWWPVKYVLRTFLHGFWALPEGTCECEVSVVTPLGCVLGGHFLWLSSTFLPLPLRWGWGETQCFISANTKRML